MSEQPVAAATRPASRAPGKTYGGLSRNQWLIVGGVFVAAVGYILWRRHKAATSASTTAATNAGSNECTDQNGNPIPCDEEFAQELAALANQLDQAQAQGGGGSPGGGGWTGATGVPTPTPAGSVSTSTATATGTPTTSTGTTSTGTTKTAAKTAGPVTGLKSSNVTKTSFTMSWNPASNASQGYSWVVRDLASHTQHSAGKTNSTSVTVGSLKSGVDYNFGIQALPGGVGNNQHVRTK